MTDNPRARSTWEQQLFEVGDAIEAEATTGEPGFGKFDRLYEMVREWHCLFEDRARLMQVVRRPHVQAALLAVFREVLKVPGSLTDEPDIAKLPASARLTESEVQDVAEYRDQVDAAGMRAAIMAAAAKAAS